MKKNAGWFFMVVPCLLVRPLELQGRTFTYSRGKFDSVTCHPIALSQDHLECRHSWQNKPGDWIKHQDYGCHIYEYLQKDLEQAQTQPKFGWMALADAEFQISKGYGCTRLTDSITFPMIIV